MTPSRTTRSLLSFLILTSVTHCDLTFSLHPPKEPAAYSKVSDGNGSEEISLLAPIDGPFTTPLCIEEFAYMNATEPTDFIDHVVIKVNLTDGYDKPPEFYLSATRNLHRLLPKLQSCTIKTSYIRYVHNLNSVDLTGCIRHVEEILNKVTWAFNTERLHLKSVEVTEEIISEQAIPEDPKILQRIFSHRVSANELKTGPVYANRLAGVPLRVQFRLSTMDLNLGPYISNVPNEWRTLSYTYHQYGLLNSDVVLPQKCIRMISTHKWESGLCQYSTGRKLNTIYSNRGQRYEFCCNA